MLRLLKSGDGVTRQVQADWMDVCWSESVSMRFFQAAFLSLRRASARIYLLLIKILSKFDNPNTMIDVCVLNVCLPVTFN